MSASTPPRTPAQPRAGGVTIDGIPWTGGKRATPKNAMPKTPFCLRPTDYKSSLKIYELAVKGEDRKFGNDLLDYPLLAFCKNVAKHMADFGLDSVFHFEKDGNAINILTNYTAFSLSEIVQKL